jgi:hypothetical protein
MFSPEKSLYDEPAIVSPDNIANLHISLYKT